MAVSFSVEHKRTSEYRMFPEVLVIHPELNGRVDKPDVEWLIADILKNGQIQPVTIRNDGGRPVLVAGFSRWRAISEINKRKLSPVKMQLRCTYLECTETEAFVANIAENRYRNSTTALDDAHNLKRLLKVYAMTEEQVLEIYFPDLKPDNKKAAQRWIKNRVALISLVPEAAKAVADGRVKETAAVAIAKLSEEQQREVVAGKGKVQGKDLPTHAPRPAKANGKGSLATIKTAIEQVIETGEFIGIGGKRCKASDDLVEFLARISGEDGHA